MLEKILSFTFILSVPLQVRHFISGLISPDEVIGGVEFIEWSSSFVYFSDIVFFLLLFVFLLDKKNRQRFLTFDKVRYCFLIIVLLSFVQIISVIDAESSLYRSFKLIELLLVFLWASSTKIKFNIFAFAVLAVGIIQSLIAIGQFITQKSLGLSFLLESPLSSLNDNVATIMTKDGIFIRGYGLLPSPNILAFFLVVSIIFLIFLFIKKRINIYLFTTIFYVLSFGLVSTFARGVIGFGALSVFVLLILLFYENKELRNIITKCFVVSMLCMLCIVGIFSNIIYERFFVAIQYDNSVSERVESYYPVFEYPENLLWGVGGGNTIYYQSQVNQPIHNSFVLFSYEWGIIVGIIFLYAIYLLFRDCINGRRVEDRLFVSIILFVFLVGNIDHFLITIQQSSFLLWMVLGMRSNKYL